MLSAKNRSSITLTSPTSSSPNTSNKDLSNLINGIQPRAHSNIETGRPKSELPPRPNRAASSDISAAAKDAAKRKPRSANTSFRRQRSESVKSGESGGSSDGNEKPAKEKSSLSSKRSLFSAENALLRSQSNELAAADEEASTERKIRSGSTTNETSSFNSKDNYDEAKYELHQSSSNRSISSKSQGNASQSAKSSRRRYSMSSQASGVSSNLNDEDHQRNSDSHSEMSSKKVHAIFLCDRLSRCTLNHLLIKDPNPVRAAAGPGLSCDICFKYIGDKNNYCSECYMNYCENCNNIRKMSLRELLLHESVLKQNLNQSFIDDQLMAYGVEIAEPDYDGELALHIAIKNECPPKVVEILACAFPDAVYVKDSFGYLPLHLAIMFNYHRNIIDMLLSFGVKTISVRDPDGLFAIHLAIKYHSALDVVQRLVRANSKTVSPLGHGSKGYMRTKTKSLFLPCEIWSADLKSRTFTVSALGGGPHMVVGEAHLRAEPSILHYALLNHADKAIIDILLDAAPELAFLRDSKGDLPLHVAIQNRAASVIIGTLLKANPSAGVSLCQSVNKEPITMVMEKYAEKEMDITGETRESSRTTAAVRRQTQWQAQTHPTSWSSFLGNLNVWTSSTQLSYFREILVQKKKLTPTAIRESDDDNMGSPVDGPEGDPLLRHFLSVDLSDPKIRAKKVMPKLVVTPPVRNSPLHSVKTSPKQSARKQKSSKSIASAPREQSLTENIIPSMKMRRNSISQRSNSGSVKNESFV